MPVRSTHITQAEHNEQLYTLLDGFGPTYRDWQTTCLFYAALHYVDAYLAGVAESPGGLHPKNHVERHRNVRAYLPALLDDYRELDIRSRQARYDSVVHPNIAALHANEFTRIRTFVRTTLSLPL